VGEVLPLHGVCRWNAQSEADVWKPALLQPGVLRLCLHQNRNVGVGVFPEGEKILVRTLGLDLEYELTPLGRGLTEPVLGLVAWLQSNWPVIRSARDRFDARKKTVARPVASATTRG
jgi:hypothetical protein